MAVPPVDPQSPFHGAMLSWKSVRGKGEAERADAEARIPWWLILIGVLIGVGILLTLLL